MFIYITDYARDKWQFDKSKDFKTLEWKNHEIMAFFFKEMKEKKGFPGEPCFKIDKEDITGLFDEIRKLYVGIKIQKEKKREIMADAGLAAKLLEQIEKGKTVYLSEERISKQAENIQDMLSMILKDVGAGMAL